MGKENTQNESYTSQTSKALGEVKIANEVIASIAGLAAAEVEGVYAMCGNLSSELADRFGMRNYTKGVKLKIEASVVSLELFITISYGYSVPKICTMIQEKVKAAIENMTGLTVGLVDVHVTGVNINRGKQS